MKRVVQELTRKELDELKEICFMAIMGDQDRPAFLSTLKDFTDEMLFGYCAGMVFGENDFLCNETVEEETE